MSDNDDNYFYRISYTTYVKLMKKWIEMNRQELTFYLNMLSQCDKTINIPESNQEYKKVFDQYVCERYKKKVFETLDNLLENMDNLYIVQMNKKDFIYFVDSYGIPYAFFVPKELQKKFKKNDSYII